MFKIVRTKQYTDTIFSHEIRTAPIAKAALPGQFVMITVNPDLAPLPLPIADFNRERGTITVVVEAGDILREQMKTLEKGNSVSDCRGPFGQPSRIENINKVVCIGGGIGVAPIFPLLREYKNMGCYTISIIGFQSKDRLFWEDRINAHCDELYITTNDGSYGIKGRVTTALRAVLENTKDIDRAVTVGSLRMMKACADITKPLDFPTFVNFNAVIQEEIWRDGRMGIAGEAQQSFSFMERTEFDGSLLDFETLIAQEKRYAEAEKKAFDEDSKAS